MLGTVNLETAIAAVDCTLRVHLGIISVESPLFNYCILKYRKRSLISIAPSPQDEQ